MKRLLILVAGTVLISMPAIAGDYPNPTLTPGLARDDVTVADLCPHANTAKIRDVSEAEKKKIFQEYGLAGNHTGYCQNEDPKGCEIDHLISLELGGSNDPRNLWPQPYGGTVWNAHVKDKLEDHLHTLVCHGMPLADAQDKLKKDWIAAYREYFGNP